MKKAFLLIVVPALLVALGFAQTPAASINTDQTIKGCLGGSDGNYTVVEDNTGHIFKVTTGSVDFKQHMGHDVTLIGHKASGASSAAADNSFAVTELNMISEHCTAAALAATATVSTPEETTVTPDAAVAAPVATASTVAQTDVTPAATTVAASAETAAPSLAVATPPVETVVTPAAVAAPPAETVVTPTADTAAPAATASTPWDKPAADAADQTRLPARSRRQSATSAAVATAPAETASETVSAPVAAAASPVPPASSPLETASAPAAVATIPAAPARHGALWLLIALAVLVIVIGTLVPFLSRWRKRKSLERTGTPNLSFTREASSDEEKIDQPGPRKAA